MKLHGRVALPLDEYCNNLQQKAYRPAVEPLPGSAGVHVAVVSAALPSTTPADGAPRHARHAIKQLNVPTGGTGSAGTSCSCGAIDW